MLLYVLNLARAPVTLRLSAFANRPLVLSLSLSRAPALPPPLGATFPGTLSLLDALTVYISTVHVLVSMLINVLHAQLFVCLSVRVCSANQHLYACGSVLLHLKIL